MKSGMDCFKLLICAISFLSLETLCVKGFLGINWGRLATQRMIPSMVVDLLLQNKINYVKLFSSSENVLEAFAGTDIQVAFTMPNQDTARMHSPANVTELVSKIVASHPTVNFTYVYVGTHPLSTKFFNRSYPQAVPILSWVQGALTDINRTEVKATMSHFTDVLIPAKKPSEGAFRKAVEALVTQSCKTLRTNQAPIGLVVFPLLSVNDLFDGDTEFGFLENNSTSVFKDGNKTYSNVVEVMYDMYDVALEKVGCPNMKINIDAIGWPTDGIEDGNIPNAQRFHQGLAKFVASKKGTPRRPGPIDVYVHNLSDENKINKSAGSFMRHWGIYESDGHPKFSFDLQGLGRDIKLVPAIGITHMPKRWCIVNDQFASDIGKLDDGAFKDQLKAACDSADCTAMDPGGSCSNLTKIQRLSYAFNVGFQATAQKVVNKSCYYQGYGMIVSDDPSTPACKFPVEILAAEIPNFNGYIQNLAHDLKPSSRSLMIAVLQALFICFILMCTC